MASDAISDSPENKTTPQLTMPVSHNVYQIESDSSSILLDDDHLTDVVETESCVFSDPEVDHPYYEDEETSYSAQQHNKYTPHSHMHLKLISTQQEPLIAPHTTANELCIDIE